MQGEFAQLVGVSSSYIQAIENGLRARSGINKRLASRMSREFGVHPGTFERAGDPPGTMVPRDWRGKPYSKQSYERFKALREGHATAHDDELEKVTLLLQMLFEAARRDNCWDPLRSSFGGWLERTLKNFGLDAELSRVHGDARRLYYRQVMKGADPAVVSSLVKCGLSQLLGAALIARKEKSILEKRLTRPKPAFGPSKLHLDDYITLITPRQPTRFSLMVPLGLPTR
jgi:transcriptional regulator with XRE-family HTH domain